MFQTGREARYIDRLFRENIQLHEENAQIVKENKSVVRWYKETIVGYRVLLFCIIFLYIVTINLFVEFYYQVQQQNHQLRLESQKIYPLLEYINVTN